MTEAKFEDFDYEKLYGKPLEYPPTPLGGQSNAGQKMDDEQIRKAEEIFERYMRFKERYGDEVLSIGSWMASRGITEDVLRARVVSELPVYAHPPDDGLMRINEHIPARSPFFSIDFLKDPLGSPYSWYAKVREVAFFEKQHPELCGAESVKPGLWINWTEVVEEFGGEFQTWSEQLKPFLLRPSLFQGLFPCVLIPRQAVRPATDEDMKAFGLDRCLFVRDYILKFKEKHPELCNTQKRKLRPDQEAKLAYMTMAKGRWDEDPTIRVKDMIAYLQEKMACKRNGDKYDEKTIRNWIKDLAPAAVKKPGRPRKKQT